MSSTITMLTDFPIHFDGRYCPSNGAEIGAILMKAREDLSSNADVASNENAICGNCFFVIKDLAFYRFGDSHRSELWPSRSIIV